MCKFVGALGLVPNMAYLISMFCDNIRAIAQVKEPRAHQKSKHIQRKYHNLREIVGTEEIIIQKIHLTDNVTDPLIKAITQKQLDYHLEKMSMRYNSDWLQYKWEFVSVYALETNRVIGFSAFNQ